MFTSDGTEVCGRMNHCIQGGVGDGDGDEDNEEGSERRRAAAAARGAPSLPPASWGRAAP
jgi:hypothetical protein